MKDENITTNYRYSITPSYTGTEYYTVDNGDGTFTVYVYLEIYIEDVYRRDHYMKHAVLERDYNDRYYPLVADGMRLNSVNYEYAYAKKYKSTDTNAADWVDLDLIWDDFFFEADLGEVYCVLIYEGDPYEIQSPSIRIPLCGDDPEKEIISLVKNHIKEQIEEGNKPQFRLEAD